MSQSNKPDNDWRYRDGYGRRQVPKENPSFMDYFRFSYAQRLVLLAFWVGLFVMGKWGREISDVMTISWLKDEVDYTIHSNGLQAHIIGNGQEPSQEEIKQFIKSQQNLLQRLGVDINLKNLYFKFTSDIPWDEDWSGSQIAGQEQLLGTEWQESVILVQTPQTQWSLDVETHEFAHAIGRDNDDETWFSTWYSFRIGELWWCLAYEEIAACYRNYFYNAHYKLPYPFTEDSPYYVYHESVFSLLGWHQQYDYASTFFNGKSNWDIGTLFKCITWRYPRKGSKDIDGLYYLWNQLANLQKALFTKSNKGNAALNKHLLKDYLSEARFRLEQGQSLSDLNFLDLIIKIN